MHIKYNLVVFVEMSTVTAALATESIRKEAKIIQNGTEWKVENLELTDSGIARFTRTLTDLAREEKAFVRKVLSTAQFARRSQNEYQESFRSGRRVRAVRMIVKAKREGHVECAYSVLEFEKANSLWSCIKGIFGCDVDMSTLQRKADLVVNSRLTTRMIGQ